MPKGRLVHERIGASAPIPGERIIGFAGSATAPLSTRHADRRACEGR